MKKVLFCILIVALLFSASACNEKQVPADTTVPVSDPPETTVQETTEPETTEPEAYVLPEGLALAGVDLSGMGIEEALAAVKNAMEEYSLTLTVDDRSLVFTAEELGLTLSETALADYFTALEEGSTDAPSGLASFAAENILADIEEQLLREARSASIKYSSASGAFEVVPEVNGLQADARKVVMLAQQAVDALRVSCDISEGVTITEPDVKQDDTRIPAALEQANRYLDISLAYTYEASGVAKTTVYIDRATLAGFVNISGSFSVSVSSVAVETYVTTMSQTYNGGLTTGNFITTHGTTVNCSVPYYGATINTTAMYEDLYKCLSQFISGVRVAPYNAPIPNMPYGGNYVEIDLTNQCLWVYKDGQCKVSTPIVSGSVSNGDATPPGLFVIYKKATNAWLAGPGYRDFVSYWIPFNGGIGMHDASWRSVFGGEIYRFDGSHGCINMPPSIAGTVYKNVTVGTRVIVYGGVTEPTEMTQEFTGTTSYEVTVGTADFQLDVKPKYIGTKITYQSDNTSVVKVSNTGLVTVVGPGTANITVTSHKESALPPAEFVVQIKVIQPCPDGEHSVSAWNGPDGPACQDGVRTGVCDLCGQTIREQVPGQDHSFASGGPECDYGCGTENPDYSPPVEPDPSEPEPSEPEPSEPEPSEPEPSEPDPNEPEAVGRKRCKNNGTIPQYAAGSSFCCGKENQKGV